MRIGLVLAALYTIYRLPLLVSPLGGWYHPMHQFTTLHVAVEAARNGPLAAALGFGPSGANLNGIFGAPIVLSGLDLRFVRLIMFVAGLAVLGFVYGIVRWYGGSDRTVLLTLLLLIVTPFFVILTSLTLPEPVTMAFAVGSLYAYLRYRSGADALGWAAASGGLAGLAALNHLWGGIATATIASYEALLLLVLASRGDWREIPSQIRRRLSLGVAHAVSLIPMILVYLHYQASGSFERIYYKYTVAQSGSLLFSLDWWKAMGAYVFEYQPATFLAIAVVALLAWRVRKEGTDTLVREREVGLIVSPLTFWSLWLLAGGFIPIMYPFGSFIHEYYLWWSIVPSVGIVAWWASEGTGGRWWGRIRDLSWIAQLKLLMIAFLLVTSATLSGLQVSRTYVGPQGEGILADGPPLICWYQRCVEPTSNEHERAVADAFAEVYEYDSDRLVAIYADFDRELRLFMRLSNRDVVRMRNQTVPPDAGIAITRTPLSDSASDWQLSSRITTDDRTTYLYLRR